MDESFDGLRRFVNSAVRQPDFAVVRGRARRLRRRRTIITGAVTAVLVLLGLGYAAQAAPHRHGQPARPVPSVSSLPPAREPYDLEAKEQVVAGGPHDLYAMLGSCYFCAERLYASADDGATWQRRTIPPAPKGATDKTRAGSVVALGPDLLAWTDWPPDRSGKRAASIFRPYQWISIDGGVTWRRAQFDQAPMAAVPPGTAPIGCSYVGQLSPCLVSAIDPATGRIAPLAVQPSGIVVEPLGFYRSEVPVDAGVLYVMGLDPATLKPAIASSADGGRSWQTTVFADGDRSASPSDNDASMVLPTIAAGAGGTAVVLLPHFVPPYSGSRTTDGGRTWQRMPNSTCAIGFVTADGAYVCSTRGLDAPARFLVSRNGGTFEPITLPGLDAQSTSLYPAQAALGLYLAPHPASSVYLSPDGVNWRKAGIP